MRAVRLIARVEIRRRWAPLLVVGLLVALVSGVVLTALVGAQRTATSVDRFRTWAHASDVSYQSDTPERADAMLAVVRSADPVATAGLRFLVNVFPADGSTPDLALMSDPAGTYGTALDRPLVLEGRMPASDAPDEILLNELAARVTGLGPGDHLEVHTWSADDLSDLFAEPDFPGFNGPDLRLEVVGIGRTPEELPGEVRRTAPYAIGSPAFLGEHPDVGAWPPAVLARLDPSETDLDELQETLLAVRDPASTDDGVTALFRDDTTAAEVYVDTARATVESQALGLVVFAVAAGLAGGLAVAQAVRRQLSGSTTPPAVLSALGLTRSGVAIAQTVPVASVGVVGTAAGAAASLSVSSYLPLGLAARAEVEPGIWLAPKILVAGLLLAVVTLAAGCFFFVRRRIAEEQMGSHRRLGAAARTTFLIGGRPAVAAGLRLASDPGRGARAVPVRSAATGIVLAVAAVVGAGVIAASLTELEEDPSRWGWTWSTMPDYFGDGDISALQARLLRDDRVERVGELQVDTIVVGDRGITAYALASLRGSMALTVRDGRLPAGPTEVALGRETMDELGAAIGDTVEATRVEGGPATQLTVVGTVIPPPTDEYSLGVGAALTPEGLDDIAGTGDDLRSLVIRFPDGADVDALELALAEDYGLEFNIFTEPSPPGSVRNLTETRNIALGLAVFFGALALIGLAQALVASSRRRRVDLAVLRVLGFRPSQVRLTMTTAAVGLAAVGAAIGIPLGLVVGRGVWRVVIAGIGAASEPQTPWVVLLVVGPVTVVLAGVVAWWPGRFSVRARPAADLRAE